MHVALSGTLTAHHSNGHLRPPPHVGERTGKTPAAGRKHEPELVFRHPRSEPDRKNRRNPARELLHRAVVPA
jgi:hypothetical protein